MASENGRPGGLSSCGSSQPSAVPPVSASIPDAVPALAERNERFPPPRFDMQGGTLGETPILWQLRMAYAWKEDFAEEDPEWDQCCICWVFAVSENEARAKVWDKFRHPSSIMPESIASCYPVRFRNERDDEIDASNAKVDGSPKGGDTKKAPPQVVTAVSSANAPNIPHQALSTWESCKQ